MRAHHFIVFVFQYVAMPHIASGIALEVHDDARHHARIKKLQSSSPDYSFFSDMAKFTSLDWPGFTSTFLAQVDGEL